MLIGPNILGRKSSKTYFYIYIFLGEGEGGRVVGGGLTSPVMYTSKLSPSQINIHTKNPKIANRYTPSRLLIYWSYISDW